MGMLNIFRKKKVDEKSAQAKHESQPGQQEKTKKTKTKRKIAQVKEGRRFSRWLGRFLRWCRELPWWRRFLIILGIVGIGWASWLVVQLSHVPPPTYSLSVTVNPSGGGNVSPSHGSYSDGTQVTLTATPAACCEFVSWSGDASGTSLMITITIDSDRQVVANFGISEYTLVASVSPLEGGVISPGSGNYANGSSVTLMATPLSNYEFVSWSGDASGTSPTVTLTIDSNKEVTANFVAIMQEIKYTMPVGEISGSVVSFSNVLNRGDIVEGFVELTGQYYSLDRSFRWTFEILGPEGRQADVFRGDWVRRNHHDFSFTAPYTGSYKIRVRHNSLYDKYLTIQISPKGW